MSCDPEMSDSDSSLSGIDINIDPDVAAAYNRGPDRVVHKGKQSLAIPAISAECERVFSSIKKLITSERNGLIEDIIEASECLKNWWDRGLIEQQDSDDEVL